MNDVKVYDYPKDKIAIIKFDLNEYEPTGVNKVYEHIKGLLPNVEVIVLPKEFDFEVWEPNEAIRKLQNMINYIRSKM